MLTIRYNFTHYYVCFFAQYNLPWEQNVAILHLTPFLPPVHSQCERVRSTCNASRSYFTHPFWFLTLSSGPTPSNQLLLSADLDHVLAAFTNPHPSQCSREHVSNLWPFPRSILQTFRFIVQGDNANKIHTHSTNQKPKKHGKSIWRQPLNIN